MKRNKTRIFTLSILMTLVILSAFYVGYINDLFIKEGINLKNSGNKISWQLNDKYELEDGYFVVYRNNKEIYRGNHLEYLDSSIEDTEKPEEVKKINIKYEIDRIILNWDAPIDKGSDNIYEVFLVNQSGRKLLKSNSFIFNYKSGINKYILKIGKNTFETRDNKLEVAKVELSLGVLNTNIKVLDHKGNEIETKEQLESIRNFSLNVLDNSNKLIINNNDKEQDYTYKIYINNKVQEVLDINNLTYNDIFKDDIAPQWPEPICYIDNNNTYHFVWEPINDNEIDYTYFIEGIGTKYNNRVFSQEFSKTITSPVKYYYKINENMSYRVTTKDEVTNEAFVSIEDLAEGSYYFQVASADNHLNISLPRSCLFTVYSKEKIKNIGQLILKDNAVDEREYNKVITELAKLPDKIVDLMKVKKTKIYITAATDLERIYYKDTGIRLKGIGGLYRPEFNEIRLINENPNRYVLHEVGHFIDYIFNESYYLSSKKEFIDIYNKEKLALFFADNYYTSNLDEYFAQAFSEYFNNYSIKNRAPQTYNYIDKIIEDIK